MERATQNIIVGKYFAGKIFAVYIQSIPYESSKKFFCPNTKPTNAKWIDGNKKKVFYAY